MLSNFSRAPFDCRPTFWYVSNTNGRTLAEPRRGHVLGQHLELLVVHRDVHAVGGRVELPPRLRLPALVVVVPLDLERRLLRRAALRVRVRLFPRD